MSWRLTKTRTLPIGIDLGTASIKLVQLRRLPDELELVAAASLALDEDAPPAGRRRPDALAGPLRDVLKTAGFKTRECVLSLPAAATVVRHVKTARLPPDELARLVRRGLGDKLPFAGEEAVVRHLVAGEVHGEKGAGLEVIVVAASRGVVEAHLSLARRCRLDVVALNVEPCAILECFARLFRRADDRDRVTLFLDFGRACTQVVIAHGQRLAFARNVMLGARQMEQGASERLGLPLEQVRAARRPDEGGEGPDLAAEQVYDGMGEALDALVGEITKCLRYYESVFPTRSIERVGKTDS